MSDRGWFVIGLVVAVLVLRYIVVLLLNYWMVGRHRWKDEVEYYSNQIGFSSTFHHYVVLLKSCNSNVSGFLTTHNFDSEESFHSKIYDEMNEFSKKFTKFRAILQYRKSYWMFVREYNYSCDVLVEEYGFDRSKLNYLLR